MMLKQFEIFRISFNREEGKIVKKFEGIIQKRDFEDIEKGLAAIIDYVIMEKQLPPSMAICGKDEDELFTILFKKDAMNHYVIETFEASVEMSDLENILSGLMFMQVKIHLQKMFEKEIKFTLQQDDSVGTINFADDSQLT